MSDLALPGAEQAPTGTPPPPQQAQVTSSPTAAPNPEPQQADEPTPEQIAQWRQQAGQSAELQRQLQQTAESARYHQSQASRFQTALQQVAGGQPQAQAPNPIDQYAQAFVAKGYEPKAARDSAELVYGIVQQTVAPLEQRLQQSQAALQGGFQVDNMLGAAMNSAPQLFANPAVQAAVRDQTMQIVMAGQQVEPAFLVDLGYIAAGRLAAQQQQQGGAPNVLPMPQYQQAQPYQNGMFRMQPNFSPQQQVGPAALPADAAFVDQEMRARFNLSPKPA